MWAESTPKGGVKKRRISSIYALNFETKSILSDRAWVDLESLSIFFCVFLCFGYKITEKQWNPSDNIVHASTHIIRILDLFIPNYAFIRDK